MRLYLLGIAALVGGAVLVGVWRLPLATEEKIVIPPSRADRLLSLQPGETWQQGFRGPGGQHKGVVVYAAVPKLAGWRLEAGIIDAAGEERARGSRLEISYVEDLLRIEILTSWFSSERAEDLIAEIRLLEGEALPLRVSQGNVYNGGQLSVDGQALERDLALVTLQPARTGFAVRQGVLAGLIALLGLAGINQIRSERWRFLAAGLLLVIVTPIALAGFWFSPGELGISDWDYYFSLHEIYRSSLLDYGVFPFWNPYTCGGTAGLADPEFPVLTATFLLEFLFGIPAGVRLAIFLSVAMGALGMLLLGRRVGLSATAAFLAAIGVSFGSVTLLEIVEGHVNVLSAMWIPWIFWSWLGAYRWKSSPFAKATLLCRRLRKGTAGDKEIRNRKLGIRNWKLGGNIWALVCGIFLALTFLAGGIYLLMYTALALAVLPWLVGDWRRAIVVSVKAGLWGVGLAAVKLVPVLLWLRQFPDEGYASSAYTLPWLVDILFGRHLYGSYIIFAQDSGWHEYGAFIGWLLFGLALIGISEIGRRKRIVRALLLSALAALLLSTAGPALKPWFDLMPYLPRSNISRIILFAVIPLSLLAGLGVDRLRRLRGGQAVAVIVVGLVAVELMSLAYPLSEQAFVLPPVYPKVEEAPAPIAFTTRLFEAPGQEGTRQTRTYAATLAGWGTFAYCSVLGPPPLVRTIHDEGANEIVVAHPDSAQVTLKEWSPNRVTAIVVADEAVEVALNTNYAKGWYVDGQPTYSFSGRVGYQVEPGRHKITFYYRTPGFALGLGMSLVTIALAVWVLGRRYGKKLIRSRRT